MVERHAAIRRRLIGCALVCLIGAAPSGVGAAGRVERRLTRPGASAAGSPGSIGWLGNPATPAGSGAVALGLIAALGGAARDGDRGAGWALHGGLPIGPVQLGFAAEHIVDAAPDASPSPGLVPNRVTLGAATQLDGWLSFGAAMRWTSDVPASFAPLTTVDIGMRAMPWPWLSAGVHVSDVLGASLYRYPVQAPATGDAPASVVSQPAPLVGPQVTAAVVLHPFTPRLRVTADLQWPNGRAIDTVRGSVAWQLGSGPLVGLLARWRSLSGGASGDGADPANLAGAQRDVRVGVFVRLGAGRARRLGRRQRWRRPPPTVVVHGRAAVGRDAAGDTAWWAAGAIAARYIPAGGLWSTLGLRRRAKERVPAHLIDIARRQQRGWRGPLVGAEQTAAAAVALAYLSISKAFATENSAAICAAFAPTVQLDVDAVAPNLTVHSQLSKAAACAQLRDPNSPWSQYRRELGPAPVHADAPRYVAGLFAIHGSPYEWIPLKQEVAYRLAMGHRTPPSVCHTWRVLPVRAASGGRRVVDVVVLCRDQRDFVMQFVGDTARGYKLSHLLLVRGPDVHQVHP